MDYYLCNILDNIIKWSIPVKQQITGLQKMSATYRIMIVNWRLTNHRSRRHPQMNYKQNEKINQVKESTLVVGIDIGSTIQHARASSWLWLPLMW